MATRTLIVITARTGASRAAIAAGRSPRKDFFELARALDADVLDLDVVAASARWRSLERLVGSAIVLACLAYSRRSHYDRIYCDGEHIGIPLAFLLGINRRRPRHVFIGHLLTTPLKRALFRWLKPQRGLDRIVVHTPLQQRLAAEQLSLAPQQLALAPYGVDSEYWRPCQPVASTDTICSAGLEYRDYETLLTAVGGLNLRLVIAAGSRWSAHRFAAANGVTPENVQVTQLDYPELLQLYARSRFVVVPLHPVLNQAGITTMLEAMAMGKAVVVTATPGQQDVVCGRLCSASGLSEEVMGGPAAFGVSGPLVEAESGIYVPPGDPAALRRAITYLLDHPAEAARMGAAGRRLVEQEMSLDLFAGRLAGLLRDTRDDTTAERSADGHRSESAAIAATASGERT